VDPDRALADDMADWLLSVTGRKSLRSQCEAMDRWGPEAARQAFVGAYLTKATDDAPPSETAWESYRERLSVLCVLNGWTSGVAL